MAEQTIEPNCRTPMRWDRSPLNFTVCKRDILTIESGYMGDYTVNHHHLAGDHYALVKQTASRLCLATVKGKYKVLNNSELYLHVEDILFPYLSISLLESADIPAPWEGEARGARSAKDGLVIKDSISYGGRDCTRQYIVPDLSIRVGSYSKIIYRCIIMNSFGAGGVHMLSGAIDTYCTNGMITGQHEKIIRMHTSSLDIDSFTEFLHSTIAQFLLLGKECNEMLNQIVTSDDNISRMLRDSGFASSDKNIHNFMELWDKYRLVHGNNMWAVYSMLTEWASNRTGLLATKITDNNYNTVLMNRQLKARKVVGTDNWNAIYHTTTSAKAVKPPVLPLGALGMNLNNIKGVK